jgi:hypothetical protein
MVSEKYDRYERLRERRLTLDDCPSCERPMTHVLTVGGGPDVEGGGTFLFCERHGELWVRAQGGRRLGSRPITLCPTEPNRRARIRRRTSAPARWRSASPAPRARRRVYDTAVPYAVRRSGGAEGRAGGTEREEGTPATLDAERARAHRNAERRRRHRR